MPSAFISQPSGRLTCSTHSDVFTCTKPGVPFSLLLFPSEIFSMKFFPCFSPHLCVGLLFLILYPASSAPSSAFTHHLSHTIFVTHHLSHTSLSHTIFHTHLCQPPSFTHYLSHTSLSTTIFNTTLSTTIFHTHLCHTPSLSHTHLCHTPSLTHIFVNHHLSHTTLSTTIFHTHRCHLPALWRHLPSFCGRRGNYGTGLALVARLGWDWSPVTPRNFAWQARHLATTTFVSRGSEALGDIYLRFAWQA